MGKAISLMRRPFKNFNVESRAHKIISQDKPIPAPRHKSDQLDMERMMKEYPEVFEESQKKNMQLDKYLKDVYVKSHDPLQTKQELNPIRPLPLDRKQVAEFEYGIKEPEKVPLGKVTLRSALKFLTDHQSDPKINTAQKIATDHSVPEETMRNVLKYFKVFEVYIPEQRSVKAKFAGPSVPRIKITATPRKVLPPGKLDKEET